MARKGSVNEPEFFMPPSKHASPRFVRLPIFSTPTLPVKKHFFSAFICALAVTCVAVNPAVAQNPARPDKVMTIAELRACMSLQQANTKASAEILQEQNGFKRDQDAVKAEQAEVSKTNDDIRARSALIVTERDAVSAEVSALSTQAQAAKTDAEKSEAEAARVKLVERSAQLEKAIDSFNAVQQVLRNRVAALNARVDAINLRNATINDRVEPQQKQVAAWRDQCGNRRFREEDEVLIKKELAAGK